MSLLVIMGVLFGSGALAFLLTHFEDHSRATRVAEIVLALVALALAAQFVST